MKLGGDEAGAGRGLAAGPSAPCPSRPFWAAAWQTSVWDLPEPVAQDQVCADKRPRGFQVWVGGWRTPAAQAESSAAHYVRCCWSLSSPCCLRLLCIHSVSVQCGDRHTP